MARILSGINMITPFWYFESLCYDDLCVVYVNYFFLSSLFLNILFHYYLMYNLLII